LDKIIYTDSRVETFNPNRSHYGDSMPRTSPRFLVLGLDGGTFDLLDPLMEAGELPFLRSMVRGGLRAPLTSVYPAKTIPAW
jgi:hypothetical protein